jgi:hypothetical protein
VSYPQVDNFCKLKQLKFEYFAPTELLFDRQILIFYKYFTPNGVFQPHRGDILVEKIKTPSYKAP